MLLRITESVAEFRRLAPAWDALWQRSPLASLLFRAEMIAGWLEQFAPGQRMAALTVCEGDQLLAGLVLVERRRWRVVRVGDLTTNAWSPTGELLVDPAAARPAVFELLADGVRRLPWPLLCLETVPVDEPDWQGFVAALRAGGLSPRLEPRYEIGQVELDRLGSPEETADTDEAGAARETDAADEIDSTGRVGSGVLPGRRRRDLARRLRNLQRQGPTRLVLHRDIRPDALPGLLDAALALEAGGWKGAAGTAVLSGSAIAAYFRCQARQLAQWGGLRLAFLEHAGRKIACEYGWTGKGVYYSFKLGYDENYSAYSPGHLLRLLLLEELAASGEAKLVDFHGPMTEALADWSTRTYRIGRLLIAPGRAGRCLLAARSALRGLRGGV